MTVKVVVIGGGSAGTVIAYQLSKNTAIELTLIDKKEYSDWNIAAPRALVDAKYSTEISIPHTSYLKKGTFLRGEVKTITDDEVTVSTSTGEKVLQFDYAVLTPGSAYPFFKATETSVEERNASYEKVGGVVKEAKEILIVGGGTTGVEVAAEIVTEYPDKKVTIVTSAASLIPALTPKAIKTATDFLTAKKATIITNDTVYFPASTGLPSLVHQTVSTSNGKQLSTDLILVTAGSGKPNTAFIEPTLPDILDEKKRIKVEPSLRVVGHPKLFAAGDACNADDRFSYIAADTESGIVIANISKLAKNSGAKGLKVYKKYPNPVTIFTLGRTKAVFVTPMFTLTGFMPRKMKSGDLFLSKRKKTLGIN